jgi:hypothetical protein
MSKFGVPAGRKSAVMSSLAMPAWNAEVRPVFGSYPDERWIEALQAKLSLMLEFPGILE